MDDFDWSVAQVFLAVAETGSLTAAARRLGLSQPTLGRRIAAAEDRLGISLFRRQARGLTLTDAGAALLEPARAMQEAARQLALQAAGRSADTGGTVRITASTAISHYHLPAIVARLRLQHPEIRVELVPSDESHNLLFREADIAVRMYRPRQLDLIARHLGDIPLGIYAATDYLDRRGRPATRDALLALDFIGFDSNPLMIEGLAQFGINVTRDWFPVRCDDSQVCWELVCAGAGVGIFQQPVGDAEPRVERLSTDVPLPALPIWLTAPDATRHTPRVRRVWDALADGLRPLCSPANPERS